MRAILYTRVSSDRQEMDGTSLDSQLAACRAHAADRGYTIIGEYTDTWTGTEYRQRPGLTHLRDTVRAGGVDVVIAYALDRLSRNQAHVYIIAEEIEDRGIRLEFVTENFEDSAVGRFLRSAKAFAAEIEHEKIVERTTRGRRTRVEKGKPLPGRKPPYGYAWIGTTREKLIVNDTEAAVVRSMFRDYTDGKSLRYICHRLTNAGIPTPTNLKSGVWSHTTVRMILKHRAYLGEFESAGLVLRDIMDPIIDEAVFETAQRRLAVNRQRSKRNAKYPEEVALLRGGFVVCANCGTTLQVTRAGDDFEYRCKNACEGRCTHLGIRTHILDAIVWERIEWLLLSDDALQVATENQRVYDPTDELKELDRGIAALDRQRDNLTRSIAMSTDSDTVAVIVGQIEQLSKTRRGLGAEREIVARQTKHFQLAQETLAGLEAWRQRTAETLDVMTPKEKRQLLEILAIKGKLWPADHDPRWVVTSDLVPAFVFTSTCSSEHNRTIRFRWTSADDLSLNTILMISPANLI